MSLTHFNSLGNPFWTILSDIQTIHITSRQKYGELKDLLQSKGVAFKDIENHLLNEAKRCGLYRKTAYDRKGFMDYPSKSKLLSDKVNWYICLNNFLTWLKNNYRDYDLTFRDWQKKVSPASYKPKNRATLAVIRTTDNQGNTKERQVEVQGASVQEVLNTPTQEDRSLEGWSETIMNSPVSAPDLSLVQIQQIVLSNLSVLGQVAKSKGKDAIDAFNVLMLELGQEQELLPVE